jgi:hypothetical protein
MTAKGRYIYDWPRPMVTVDAVVFGFFAGRTKLLLINRKNEPFKGRWALPAGMWVLMKSWKMPWPESWLRRPD